MIYPSKTVDKVLEYLKDHTYSETAKHFKIPIGTIASWKYYSKNKTKVRKMHSIEDKMRLWKQLKKQTRDFVRCERKLK